MNAPNDMTIALKVDDQATPEIRKVNEEVERLGDILKETREEVRKLTEALTDFCRVRVALEHGDIAEAKRIAEGMHDHITGGEG